MKSLPFLFALALVVPIAHAQDAALSVSQVPLRADAPQLFAPRGWTIEKRVSGDLNRDQVADAALVLVENKPAKNTEGDPSERSRALVVLLREGKGWRRAGFNNSLLLGTRDGGALYGAVETPVNVSIKNHILIVQMESGSREVEETAHRFRFEPKKNGVFLVGFDSTMRDRTKGTVTTVSSNFLSGRETIMRSAIGGNGSVVTGLKRVSRRLRSLESLREADRDAR